MINKCSRTKSRNSPSLTILFSGLNISGAIQPSVPIAPVWHVTEFLPYASFLQSPKSDIMAFTSPLALRLEIRTLWGLMSRWTEMEKNNFLFSKARERKPTRITRTLSFLQLRGWSQFRNAIVNVTKIDFQPGEKRELRLPFWDFKLKILIARL